MLRVNYNIQFKNRTVSPILISITWKKNRIQKSIGQSVETSYWDYKKGRVKSSHPDAVNFNSFLYKIDKGTQDYYNELNTYSREPSKSKLKERLENILNNGVSEEKKNSGVIDIFDKFIEEYRVNGMKPRVMTLNVYRTCRNKLFRFQESKGVVLQFDDITSDFYDEFVEYQFGLDNNNNTVGTNIRKLKTFMKWARLKKYHNSSDYESFKVLKSEAVYSIVLTKNELDRIINIKTDNPSVEFAKLFMVVNCWIGLRASDLLNLIKNYEINSNKVRFFQQKTKALQTIQIPNNVLEMINRLKELYKPNFNRDYINTHLRTVGQLAEMNDIETSQRFVGNRSETVSEVRWKLLTTHVGKRTFATRAMELRKPIHVIMELTGHKTLESFQKYINPSSFDNKDFLNGFWGE